MGKFVCVCVCVCDSQLLRWMSGWDNHTGRVSDAVGQSDARLPDSHGHAAAVHWDRRRVPAIATVTPGRLLRVGAETAAVVATCRERGGLQLSVRHPQVSVALRHSRLPSTSVRGGIKGGTIGGPPVPCVCVCTCVGIERTRPIVARKLTRNWAMADRGRDDCSANRASDSCDRPT